MSRFGWAVVGPGRIAQRFAHALSRLDGTRLAAVQGRDRARATQFAAAWSQHGEPAVFTSLEAMLRADGIDGVYIATPHAFHAEAVRACLEVGKPVLCEKSLTPNAALSRELVSLSEQRRVFLMEALWTRFLPIYETIAEWLTAQSIGPIRGLQSSFCFNVPFDPNGRHFDPAQAGGALLDIGVYNLSMTQWALRCAMGSCPALADLTVHGQLGPTGVDHRVAATLAFSGGIISQFQCGFDGHADNALRIFGEHGVITVPSRFWEATSATRQLHDQAPVSVQRPFAVNGFEGEIAEAMRCIARGDHESTVMPHAETLMVADWMDRIRARLGVSYPFE